MQVASFTQLTANIRWQSQNPDPAQRSSAPSQGLPSAEPADDQLTGPASEHTQKSESSDQLASKASALQQAEQLELAKLASRDQEVRVHEQAHAAVGGRYAGAPTYTFEQGPDGKRYAVAGEVGIDVSAVPNDPEATLRKMEVVIRAALSPAEPSAQDRQIAAQAQIQMAEARAELAQIRSQQREETREVRAEKPVDDEQKTAPSEALAPASESADALELYRQISVVNQLPPLIDLAV